MVRIRSIKPEFWRSEDIARLSWPTRLLFIGLWSYVDDNGVGRDIEQLIAADLFALEYNAHDTLMSVHGGLTELSNAGLIVRYEVSGKRYLAISTWSKHQKINRPSPPRYPAPDQGIVSEPGVLSESSVSPHAPEQGNRGTGEQGVKNTSSPAATEHDFERAWSHWPKKTERKKSFEKFKVVARRRGIEQLVADVIRFGDAYAATTERQFVPALNVWLNGERWTDPLPQARGRAQELTNEEQNLLDYRRRFGGGDGSGFEGSQRAIDSGVGY